ncbi:MAG: NADPH-dependent 7-cyano-7-deazaguanine reductase QueF [Candidatus Dactylopiibacterium carminicum]|uniref:NADPH-dependent 7-cyano-7-deazaguanine reductase n=1 Tax=Candidatus Dactylopiibacterium carminicum TaxID=857335 RepID=A0A272EXV2_9RHOO|nr:NADPH-dependent 7-cyano-7-deazaguanine reductase QueF [Candidatus Dactylopiibacterium carminicum]KAF7600501.1 NADPH-dependent 7-cyano-7-deazaguanine reductase QueF [Candidatus Dactylopiibacterium carminicum]PAS94931.1 MAG: NADPH-dependent 7-cyano-7-deazaguanine reductase QueF [Candidatus Dactylopiibacterium carminicum]PAS98066.1 MAG: NADPH-dependent 7-cyano-7-deazaguanine reductase QueF [Candidatus Dactylopiibacterium carminicum]PAT00505.1 MAG: NADPH-dependent 7-cyano-7-deazaguanine reductas
MSDFQSSLNTPSDSPLGKSSAYRSDYAPELLFPIPRRGKREEIGVDEAALPFVGEDLWNAYELSWLDPRGKPVVALGEFRVPASSPCLIESKSLKLYLNSFNQTRLAGLGEAQALIARDLSQAAGSEVQVCLQSLDAERVFVKPVGVCLDAQEIEIDRYQPEPELLRADPARVVQNELLYSHLLKSNCLVTGQPDWGAVFVRYSGLAIDREALLRYIVSFREHNEFHEQCVERIFCDLMRQCRPATLMVWARYTRRGGLDINPCRVTPGMSLAENLGEVRQ